MFSTDPFGHIFFWYFFEFIGEITFIADENNGQILWPKVIPNNEYKRKTFVFWVFSCFSCNCSAN